MLKKGLCVLAVLLMFGCALSAGVLAEEKVSGEGLVNLESIQLKSADGQNLVDSETSETETVMAAASEGDYKYIDYSVGGGGASGVMIIKYTGSSTKVTIPAVINGELVLRIYNGAFSESDNVVEVVVSNGIETISGDAFRNCENLTKISLPKSIKNIYGNPVSDCDKLTEIQIDPDNTSFTVVNGLLLNRTGDTLVACPSGKTSVIIPEGVTSIGPSAFKGCDKLQTIQLPSTLETIEDHAFQNCEGMSNITIPDKATNIGFGAFVYCDKLENVSFGKSLTQIEAVAFSDCDKLKEVTFPANLTAIYGSNVFARCPQLAKVVIPETTTEITSNIFIGSPLVKIYGKTSSYAQTYANSYSIPFVSLGLLSVESFTTDLPTGQKINTSIQLSAAGSEGKTPYQYKFTCQLNGTVTTLQDFGSASTATFTPGVAGDYTLMVEVKDADGNTATKSKMMRITDGTTAEPALKSFIGKDPGGNYFQYPVDDFNNAYLAYQIKPELPAAKMYQQFLNSQCQIVALEDAAKGYLDYGAAANACLLAQMKKESFDLMAYLASDDAKLLKETVTNIKTVDKDGNVIN